MNLQYATNRRYGPAAQDRRSVVDVRAHHARQPTSLPATRQGPPELSLALVLNLLVGLVLLLAA
jgi:hypothetical protein